MTTELHIPGPPRAVATAVAPRPSLETILARVAFPFLLFSLVLVSLLSLSWLLLLPRYTSIDVGGKLRSADGIRQYTSKLTAQIATKEEERQQLVLAVHDPQYDALKKERTSRLSLDDVRTELLQLAKAVTGKDDVVHIGALAEDSATQTITLRGDIRNVSTRSMTVLAQFADALKKLSFVSTATTPAFTREEEKTIGLTSPFTITLTLTQ